MSLTSTFHVLTRLDEAAPGLTLGALVAHIRLSRDAADELVNARVQERRDDLTAYQRLDALSRVAALTESSRVWDAVCRSDEDAFIRAVAVAHGRSA